MTPRPTAAAEASRTEIDFGGPVAVPAEALWGAQTQRALEAFTVSDLRLPRAYLGMLGSLKRAAARVNAELGELAPELAEAIAAAAGEVRDGRLDPHFPIDLFQTGSGTNTNMNANEVIANRANQLLGHPAGTRSPVHPNDHVNLGQSSNDVIPTVLHAAAQQGITHDLLPSLAELAAALRALAQRTDNVVKVGRTHLQDAVPIRLGQEFAGHAGQIERGITRVRAAQPGLAEVALGGTAVGTGINTHPEFGSRVAALLAEEHGVELRETENHFQAQNTLDAVAFTSGALRTVALGLLKITDDIRWMSSGPRAGLNEIEVPTLSMSSSIMPGKTNPIVAEAVAQVATKVVGDDAAIALAAGRGNFEISVMFPVAAYCLLETITLLSSATRLLANRCVVGIRATDTGPAMAERSLMTVTTLSPRLGYDLAARITSEARRSGDTIRNVALRMSSLDEDELVLLLDPRKMTGSSDAGEDPAVRP